MDRYGCEAAYQPPFLSAMEDFFDDYDPYPVTDLSTSVPKRTARNLSFFDKDCRSNTVGGPATLIRAAEEHDVIGYRIYLGSVRWGKTGGALVDLPKVHGTGTGPIEFIMPRRSAFDDTSVTHSFTRIMETGVYS